MRRHLQQVDLPPLPLEPWEASKNTLHLFLQMVGKTRLALHPKLNHWWHVPLYVSPRGLTTRTIPYGAGSFEVLFDFHDHRLGIETSAGDGRSFPLAGLAVAEFHERYFAALAELGIDVLILAKPYDNPSKIPFAEDHEHAAYDAAAVHRFWKVLSAVNGIFEEFRGRFLGKATPVHLFWHSFDLAYTRFSGAAAPLSGGTKADAEAYSHALISFGFWPGDASVREPAFYSYTYPEPVGLAEEAIDPPQAQWVNKGTSHLAFYPYAEMRGAEDPRQALLAFLESTYAAGAGRAGWPFADFAHSPRAR
jgi:hypothetical protein